MSNLTQFFGGGGDVVVGEFLACGGGGGGGMGSPITYAGGGGGAGFILYQVNATFDKGVAIPIAVGAGGAGATGTTTPTRSKSGGTTSVGIMKFPGGGAGGSGANPSGTVRFGADGVTAFFPSSVIRGSGGGGGDDNAATTGGDGANTSSQSLGVGSYNTFTFYGSYPGASAPTTPISGGRGGGGCLSSAPGVPGPVSTSNGGLGIGLSITGSVVTYCEGGFGAADGATGGGTDAAANTGCGGSGGCGTAGGAGGSGVVIFAYPTAYNEATATGTYDNPSRPGYYVYRFTGPGSITFI